MLTKHLLLYCSVFLTLAMPLASSESEKKRPNILWIIAEDLSPFFSCYGDSVNKGKTPNIDQLAKNGIMYTKAYSTAPVCSASRSAFITGVMQTSTGTHQHRSSRTTDGEVVPEHLRIHLPAQVKTIPELMKMQGYFTFNSGKDDYNFHYNRSQLYDVGNASNYKPGMNGWQGNKAENTLSYTKDVWNARKDKNQPWFGQIEIKGGKGDKKYLKKDQYVKPYEVDLPPYFPEHKALRSAWAIHYSNARGSDVIIGKIMEQLKKDGELENTIVFFFSDHGSNTSYRHKQFCYEGGMLVPLIIAGDIPHDHLGSANSDLVSLLDVSATTLALGGAKLPTVLDGQNLFSPSYQPNKAVFGARDRCDYTIDKIRTVRTPHYRYIRNYHVDRPMLQAGYRDEKAATLALKTTYKEGQMTSYQEEHWFGIRPAEELYDLEKDPHQMNNLAIHPKHLFTLRAHRDMMDQWIKKSKDQGIYPESSQQLKATYDLWKDEPIFIHGDTNPEFDLFQ
jgi:arylsulfatase A-like enzyme